MASEACIPHAIAFAKTFGSSITLFHVMRCNTDLRAAATNDALGWELARQEAQSYLTRLQGEVATALGAPVDVRLEQGRPSERIADVGRELEVGLTFLGSGGDGGAPRWTIGSTTQRVLSGIRGSIFIAHSESPLPVSAAPTRILLPLDGSLRAESAVPTAACIARTHGAELLLVHVVEERVQNALLRAEEDLALARKLALRIEEVANRYLDDVAQQLKHDGVTVRTIVLRHAKEHQGLLELAERETADLIVLSAHGQACDSARCFGSVATYLLTHSPVPLLVLQDLPGPDANSAQHSDSRPPPPPMRASYAPESV